MNIACALTLTIAVLAGGATGQTIPAWDTSGNSLLNGTYNFRDTVYVTTSSQGRVGRKLVLYGTMTFDGRGNYTIAGTEVDTTANNGAPSSVALTGAYEISASGLGSMTNPLSTADTIYGLVSNGIFLGGSTESAFNDLLIAAPASASFTAASFKGNYNVTAMDVPSASAAEIQDSWYQAQSDGKGNLGTVALLGYVAGGGASPVSQSLPGVTYTFTNGVGTVSFPNTPGNLVTGNKTLYLSPDGSFIFGGSPDAFDMFIGVLAPSAPIGNADFAGIYYQAGIDQDASQIGQGLSGLDNFYGSMIPISGQVLSHQRLNSLSYTSVYDYTYSDTYTLNSDGSSSDTFQNYWIGAGGKVRVGVGRSPYLGLSLAVKAPTFQGPGVYINPTGIVNAGSLAPFTAGIAPGEYVTVFGTNLAPGIAVNGSIPAPTTLNGVQVFVNGVAAPVTYVNPNQVTFLIPFATQPIAAIKVVNNGVSSNKVTSYMTQTSPGAFTIPANGISAGAMVHLNGTLVSEDSPAQAGEILELYVGGLGSVTPAISDGAPGGITQFNQTSNQIRVYMDGQQATVGYAGLAPGEIGVYQLNVTVPAGTHTGDVFLDVAGPDFDTSEAYVPIASGSGTVSAGLKAKPAWHSSGSGPAGRTGEGRNGLVRRGARYSTELNQ